MTVSRLLLSTLLVPLLAMPSGAQRIAPVALRVFNGAPMPVDASAGTLSTASLGANPEPVRERSVMRTVIGGVMGGALGTLVGGMIGSNARSGCQGDLCGIEGALLGVLIGEPLGLAIGAHIGSGSPRHERMLLTSLASAGILVGGVAAGLGVSQIGSNGAGAIMIPVTPLLQIITAVAIEAH
jgi:hypothetical protein